MSVWTNGIRIAVTGSIATDYLMVYRGRFTDSLIGAQLAKMSLSFLVDDLRIRRGGVAANIAFGLGTLGLRPLLVGAVGTDFAEYETWLRQHGVDTGPVRVSRNRHTAWFMCATDVDQNQIATFYPGAMAEAREIDLAAVAERTGRLDWVHVAPDDPQAMLRHTDACRRLGSALAADPSQQLATLNREETRRLVTGARLLFTNEYESALLQERTGWTESQVLERVNIWIVTRGAAGVTISGAGRNTIHLAAVPVKAIVDPTGVGDGFRAGFLAGLGGGLSCRRAAQLGCAMATLVLETAGTQEYRVRLPEMSDRIADAYGSDTAQCITAVLSTGKAAI